MHFANITDRTVRRRFREQQHRQRPLTVLDHRLPSFGLQVTADDARTWFVHVVRNFGPGDVVLGTSANLTAEVARKKAVAAIEAAQAEREAGPLMRVFAHAFVRRRARRWLKLRGLAGLEDVRIHDWRRTHASQGIMNGVGPPPGSCSVTDGWRQLQSLHTSTMLPCTPPPRRQRAGSRRRWGSRPRHWRTVPPMHKRSPTGPTYSERPCQERGGSSPIKGGDVRVPLPQWAQCQPYG